MVMNEIEATQRREKRNKEVHSLVDKAKKVCSAFFDTNYKYETSEAVEELGLDEELIHQLVEDYIAQIIKSVLYFEEMLYELQSKKDAKQELNYTPFRDLAHKNLGVARNLRIKDAEIILTELMKKDDLEYLFLCIEVLRACAILLNPICAFNTIKLIEVKSTF